MTTNDWSVPESEVLAEARRAFQDDRRAVLATVIDVEGNAYRRPGAKMLITPDGGLGSITAGCIEDDVRRLAEEVLAEGSPRVETYDLMADDDEDVWGLGVGCDGIIDVLLEPLTAEYRPAITAYHEGTPIGVLTIVEGNDATPQGKRAYYLPDEGFTSRPEWVSDRLSARLDEFVVEGGADTVELETDDGPLEVFIDAVTPPPKVLVFGSGHDVGPVTELASNVDFRVEVVSFRGAAADSERFPAAAAVHSTSPPRLDEVVDLDSRTYAVVMTHNFIDDRLTVEWLLDSPVPYVGLLGPRDRFEQMREAFNNEGRTLSETELERLYTPAGLDLGGGTPYHIAHSIVAELLIVANDREPQHLSTREGPIHERLDLESPAGDP